MIWNVYRENFNRGVIVKYNIFDNISFADDIIKLLNEGITKDDFEDKLRQVLFYYFGGKTEYETVITSWPVYINRTEFYRLYNDFGQYKIRNCFPYKINIAPEVGKKVSICDQVLMNWEQFVEYLWSNKDKQSNMTN